MAYGNPSSPGGYNSYKALTEAAQRMRNPKIGKKIANNTHLRLEGETFIVRHYSTEILRFYPNGSIDIKVASNCCSNTTRDRIWAMTGCHIFELPIPAVNGYKTYPAKKTFIAQGGWGNRHNAVAYAYNETDNYIRLLPDKAFDMETVVAHQVECISNPAKMRAIMKHMGKVVRVALGYAKLAGNEDMFEKGTEQLGKWLLDRYNVPIEEISIQPFPSMWIGNRQYVFGKRSVSNAKNIFRAGIDAVRYDIARREGCIGQHAVLRAG